MANLIYVNYLSRFANNIFQYALAHIIQDLTGGEIAFSPTNVIKSGPSHDQVVEGIPIQDNPVYLITNSSNILVKPEWSGKFKEEEKVALRGTGVMFAEDILEFKGDALVLSRSYQGQPIILSGYYQDFRYYKGKSAYVRNLLTPSPIPRYPGDRDMVLNFRGTDLAEAQMPFSFYRWILEREQFEKLWIVTEDPKHPTVAQLSSHYSAEVLSNGAINDFTFVMAAKKIIMSVSTFCWMAGWLSDASVIYYPLGGTYSGFRRNDRQLIATDDPRYRYVRPAFDRTFLRRLFPIYHSSTSV